MSGELDTWGLAVFLGQLVVRSSAGTTIICLVSLIALRRFRSASFQLKHQVLCATHLSIAAAIFVAALGLYWFKIPLVSLGTTTASGKLQVLASDVGSTARLQWIGNVPSGAFRLLFAGLGWIWLIGFAALTALMFHRLITSMVLSRLSCDRLATLQIRRRLRRSVWSCPLALSQRIVVCRRLVGPTLVGWGGRMIGLPAESTHWDNASLRAVVTHEHEHILHRDFLRSCGIVITHCANWFNPLVWWVAHQSQLEREVACDERSIAKMGIAAVEYFQLLLRVARSLPSSPNFQPPAMGGKSALFRRAERLTREVSPGHPKRSLFRSLQLLGWASILVAVPLTDWGVTRREVHIDAVVQRAGSDVYAEASRGAWRPANPRMFIVEVAPRK